MHIQETYRRDGFLINTERRLPEDIVGRAREGMMAIRRGEYDTGRPPEGGPWKPGDSDNVLCKIEMPQMASRAIFDLVSHPLLGEIAAKATGATMVQAWWVQLLYKPPTPPNQKSGTNVGWHQDRSYWGAWEEGSELFTAWVALSDVTRESGPMLFVRGSHHWGFLPGGDFFAQDLEKLEEKIRMPSGQTWEEVPAILPPGGFSLHHNLLWHGSGPNRSATPRLAFAIHMRTQNSRPVENKRAGLTKYIDDPSVCPIVAG